MAHANLAPSSAPIWGNCSGSVRAQAGRPSLDTIESRDGTAAHWVGSEVLLNRKIPGRGAAECAAYLGQTAPNGVVIDAKMVDGAGTYVAEVAEVCDRFDAWGDLRVEARVSMPGIHPDNWGTLDAALYLPARNTLFLWDYKHGHRVRRAGGDLQMADYLAGLADDYRIDGHLAQHTYVVMRIVQPFAYSGRGPVSEWAGMLTDARPLWNKLSHMAHEALHNPTLTTGVWCRDCLARVDCAAALRAGHAFVDFVNEPYEMHSMRGHNLAVEREILRAGVAVAQSRLEAIEAELHYRIARGDTDSGLTLEATRGALEWSVPPSVAVGVARQLGVDAETRGVMTPTQTLAAAPADVRPMLKHVLNDVTRRATGKPKLVPAVESMAARAFKHEEK